MRYLLPCPCGHQIPVSRSQAGATVTCGVCGRSVEVPTIRGLTNLPPAPEETAERTVGKRTAPRWSTSRRLVSAVCFGLMLVAGSVAGLMLATRLNYSTGWTLEQELTYGDQMVERYEPAELWDLWSVYREEGLGPKTPPEYVLVQRQLDARAPYMYAAFGLAAAGLVGWLATIVTAPRAKTPVE